MVTLIVVYLFADVRTMIIYLFYYGYINSCLLQYADDSTLVVYIISCLPHS